jgi:hypothetical protein
MHTNYAKCGVGLTLCAKILFLLLSVRRFDLLLMLLVRRVDSFSRQATTKEMLLAVNVVDNRQDWGDAISKESRSDVDQRCCLATTKGDGIDNTPINHLIAVRNNKGSEEKGTGTTG